MRDGKICVMVWYACTVAHRRRTTSPAENISIAIQQRFQDPEFSCSLWHGLGYKDDDYAEGRIDFETSV